MPYILDESKENVSVLEIMGDTALREVAERNRKRRENRVRKTLEVKQSESRLKETAALNKETPVENAS